MICLSIGEAEFNGGVCASSEGLFYHQLLGFLGVNTKMRVHLDSGTDRGVFQRQGARHKGTWKSKACGCKLRYAKDSSPCMQSAHMTM